MDLTPWDEEYDKAPEDGSFALPIGKYQTTVKELRFKTTTAGDKMLEWTLVVFSGPYAGRKIMKNSFLPTEGGDPERNGRCVGFIKAEVSACGLKMKFSELPDRLGDFPGTSVVAVLAPNDRNPKFPYVNLRKPELDTDGEPLPF